MKESQRRQWQKVGEGLKSGVVKSDKTMRPSKPIAAICQLTTTPQAQLDERDKATTPTKNSSLLR